MGILEASLSGLQSTNKPKSLRAALSDSKLATYSSIPTGTPIIDTTNRPGKTIVRFTGSGSITIDRGGIVEALIVGGGGGGGGGDGGGYGNGGAGAGGFNYLPNLYLESFTTYTIVVGAGGAMMASGENSRIDYDILGWGGGLGAGYSMGWINAATGGSGGGAALSTQGAGSGLTGQGNSGNSGNSGGPQGGGGGGGGGAGGSGFAATSSGGGAGGIGLSNSILGTSSFYCGGGGGGGGFSFTGGGVGGSSIGGSGGGYTGVGGAGTVNTGSGGGGGGARNGGAGGSGVIILVFG